MKVAVGSTNPVKVESVTRAFAHYFKDAKIQGVEVDSGVHHTPRDAEMIKGAVNRAKAARTKAKADFGVGLEGGLISLNGKTHMTGYVAITDGKRTHGAYAMSWELPEKVVKQIDAGKELGTIIDELSGTSNSKQHAGSAGFFSKGALPRADAFYQAVIGALIPFVSREFY